MLLAAILEYEKAAGRELFRGGLGLIIFSQRHEVGFEQRFAEYESNQVRLSDMIEECSER